MAEIYKTDSISDISNILKSLISQFGNLSGAELAKRTGLTISTVNRLLAGSISDPKISTLKPLAEYFGITVDQLLGFTALPEKLSENDINLLHPSMVIPVYGMSNFLEANKNQQWFTWVTQKIDKNEEVFAISLDTERFEPVFEKDTILVIEPGMLPPQNSDYLLIKFNDENQISIQRYYIEGNEHYFIPINLQLKAIPTKEKKHTILGVITEAHTRMRDKL